MRTWALSAVAAGDRARAREILTALEVNSESGVCSAYYPALVRLGLGEHDQALAWLEAVEKERPANVILTAWLKPEPIWDPLRSDPRFQALLRRMNFPQ